MRQYASSSRKDKSGYERLEEKEYKGLKRAKVALPVWPTHQPRHSLGETSVRGSIIASLYKRREKAVPAGSLREFQVKGKTEKTRWRR